MALNQFTNNAGTTLASGINNSATSLTVSTGSGALFPTLTGSAYFYCTLQQASGGALEIVKVTARSTDTFTIVRAQDGTTALSFVTGDYVQLRLTAADLNNFGQLDSTNTWASSQTFTSAATFSAAPITTSLTGYLYGNGSSALTASTTIPFSSVTGTVPTTQGGTNLTSFTSGGAVYATSTSALTTGTLPVTAGGTGVATLTTAYGVLAAGTTATGAVQNIGTGTTGQILTSNGSGALPTFQAAPATGGLTSLGTVTLSGTTQQYSLSSLTLTSYKYLYVILNGVNAPTGPSKTISISSASGDQTASSQIPGGGPYVYGGIFIDLTTGLINGPSLYNNSSVLSSPIPLGTTMTASGAFSKAVTAISTSTTTIYVYSQQTSANAGTLTFYGAK